MFLRVVYCWRVYLRFIYFLGELLYIMFEMLVEMFEMFEMFVCLNVDKM